MRSDPRSSVSLDQLQNLITSIYDAALDPDNWGKALEKLCNTLNAEHAHMRIINTDSKYIQASYSHNKDPHWIQAYKDHYIHIDPWLNKLLHAKNTFIACTHHLMTDKEYESMEFHRDFVHPQKGHYGLGGKIHVGNRITSYLALNRARNRCGFEDVHLNTLQQLVQHLQKALLINEKTRNIELKKNLLSDSLNQINNPLLLVDKNAQIVFINSLAEQLIQQHAGISIKNNQISFQSREAYRKLQKLIFKATTQDTHNSIQQGGSMCYTHSASQSSISILISPVNPNKVNNDTACTGTALIALSQIQHQYSLSTELLTGLYNFTSAEARLTAYLCQGLTLDEISKKLILSKNTLRSQLRSSFNKTGVARQAELISLVNSGPAGIIKLNKLNNSEH